MTTRTKQTTRNGLLLMLLVILINNQQLKLASSSASTWAPPAATIPQEKIDPLFSRQSRHTNNNNIDYDDFAFHSNNNDNYNDISGSSYHNILAEISDLRNNPRIRELLQSSNFRIRCACPQVTCNCGNATAVQQSGAGDQIRCVCDCGPTPETTRAVVAALTRQQSFGCPVGTLSDLSSFAPSKCYFLSSALSPRASLADAALQCSQGMGNNNKHSSSKLAEPRTDAEARALLDIIAKETDNTTTSGGGVDAYWTGIVELVAPTASELVYISQAQPLPRSLELTMRSQQKPGATAHDCYAISVAQKNNNVDDGEAQWSNRDCSELLRYVCEMQPVVV